MNDVNKFYTRCFNTDAGARVLEHLRSITIERFLGPNATESDLRFLEAQRALVHQIINLAARGKNEN